MGSHPPPLLPAIDLAEPKIRAVSQRNPSDSKPAPTRRRHNCASPACCFLPPATNDAFGRVRKPKKRRRQTQYNKCCRGTRDSARRSQSPCEGGPEPAFEFTLIEPDYGDIPTTPPRACSDLPPVPWAPSD
ncbi:hypothetical protein AURDEDRAFT_180674 [Auricularia subglabra TFB-10046 SS5]|nr:hypothetical protein AURDEDRAFT_180674 [Auricularia subglabra TFB-10046 SS5]